MPFDNSLVNWPNLLAIYRHAPIKLVLQPKALNHLKRETGRTILSMDAWIPDRRELTREEKALVSFLLKRRSDLEVQLEHLKVTGRCVCGCPTVAFGSSTNEKIAADGGYPVVEYRGRAENGTLVGVYLKERQGKIVELEGVGWDGEFEKWPPIEKLQPENSPAELVENNAKSSSPSGGPQAIKRLTAVQKLWVVVLLLTMAGTLLQLLYYLKDQVITHKAAF